MTLDAATNYTRRSGSAYPRTEWDFRPCVARRCMVQVLDDPRYPQYWAKPYVGKSRQAVEVVLSNGEKKLLDNEDGTGWLRVTQTPLSGYRELQGKVIGYLE